MVLFQITHNGNAAVGRDFDGTALHFSKLNVEFGNLIRIAPGGASAVENSVRNLCAGDGQDDFLVIPNHLAAVGGFGHSIGNHIGL